MDLIRIFLKPKPENRLKNNNQYMRCNRLLTICVCLILLACLSAFANPVMAQRGGLPTPTPPAGEAPLEAPERVDIQPTARDEEIRARLTRILEATGWFTNPEVEVEEGVVFLTGRTETAEFKKWAGDLARNTQDVVAVVNQMELIQPSIWDLTPALTGLRELWFNLVSAIPLIGFSLIILLLTWVITRLIIRGMRFYLRDRLASLLLTNVAAYITGTVVFLIGLYVILQIAGLTGVALTVVGGTGILGLVLGIAFRDITENFLASIFLSLQTPFRSGDVVEIVGILGVVQALTTRATLLMTFDGNHVQIPNATVYKSNIINYTSNPNRRIDFLIGIGYEDSVTKAQEIALKVLEEHPAVLSNPEPWVLVENLGSATVNLCIYFWLDGTQHSLLKVKSSVIRLVKIAFQNAGISMPDEAREMIFPQGVNVRLEKAEVVQQPGYGVPKPAEKPESISTEAEAGLGSEAGEIEEQARHSRTPEEGENLLKPKDQE